MKLILLASVALLVGFFSGVFYTKNISTLNVPPENTAFLRALENEDRKEKEQAVELSDNVVNLESVGDIKPADKSVSNMQATSSNMSQGSFDLVQFLEELSQSEEVPLESVQPLKQIVYAPELSGEMTTEALDEMQYLVESADYDEQMIDQSGAAVDISEDYFDTTQDVVPKELLEQESLTPSYFGKTVIVQQ